MYYMFWDAKATNEGKSADFAHFNSRIGCRGKVATSLEPSEKGSNQ